MPAVIGPVYVKLQQDIAKYSEIEQRIALFGVLGVLAPSLLAKRHVDKALCEQLVGNVDDVPQEQRRDGGGYAKAAQVVHEHER